METEIATLEKKLSTLGTIKNGQVDMVSEPRELLRQIKVKKLCVESQIASSLPVELVGYLGEDIEEVDQDEHGTVNAVYYYLGCPIFPNERQRHYGTVGYDKLRDVTEVLQHNIGRFLKVTIEAVPLGETKECAECDKRFQCLTTRVRG